MKPIGTLAASIAALFLAGSFGPAAAQQGNPAADKQASKPQGAQSKQPQRGEAPPKGAPLIVLVPVTQANSEKLGNGCWARLYDGDNFQGNQLTLVGPVDMPTMRTAFGTDWGGEFDSIAVGPRATVTVYDNENFRERSATFKPSQKVADMSERMGLFEDVRSLKIACSGAARTAQKGTGAGAGSGASAGGGSGASKK